MSSPVASVGLVDSLPLAPSSSGGSSPTTPPIATRGPDTELMDTLNDTSMDDNSTHPLDDVPNHLHHTVVVMTADGELRAKTAQKDPSDAPDAHATRGSDRH